MQALVQQVAGIALAKGTRVISDSSLFDASSGIENLKDPTLRKLLDLEDLALPVPDLPVDMDIEPEKLNPASCPATDQGEGERVGSDLSDDELAQQLVGKVTIEKLFSKHGYFSGLIQSYDADAKLYTVHYEDDEEEQLSLKQLRPYILRTEHAHLLQSQPGKHAQNLKEEAEAEAGADDVESKQAPNEANASIPCKPLATKAASLTVTQNPVHSPEPSDDEGNKTESVSSTNLLYPLFLLYSEISSTFSCSLAAALWSPCACFSRGKCQSSSYPCKRAS